MHIVERLRAKGFPPEDLPKTQEEVNRVLAIGVGHRSDAFIAAYIAEANEPPEPALFCEIPDEQC